MGKVVKAIWAYTDISDGYTPLHIYRFDRIMMYASVCSFIKFAPKVQRKIYLDRSIKDLLERYDLLQYWDEVELLDIEVPNTYPRFYAMPKVHCYGDVDTPYFVVDHDSMLSEPLDNWWTPEKNYLRVSKWNEGDRTWVQELFQGKSKAFRSFMNPDKFCEGNFMFFRDPKLMQIVMPVIRDICLEVTDDKNSMWEEGCVYPILEYLKEDICEIPWDRGYIHWWPKRFTCEEEEIRAIQKIEKVLGEKIDLERFK